MQSRAKRIQKATEKARRSWVAYTEAQMREILDIMKSASAEITSKILAYEKEGVIPPSRLKILQDDIKREMVRVRVSLGGKIKSGMSQSVHMGMESGVLSMDAAGLGGNVKVAVGDGFITAAGKVARYNPAVKSYAESTWARIHGKAMDFLLRNSPEGLTLSDKVWNISWEAEKAIRRAVNVGVIQGKPVAQVSREVRGFLAEPNRLYRRVRRGGRLVPSAAAREYHPGRGVYRSSAKNAMRMARTEYQRAFHEGSVRYMQTKDWIDGAIWRIGNVDACEICMELADRFFPKDEIPQVPHPQCLCHLENHIKGEEFGEDVRGGKPDPEKIQGTNADLVVKGE